MVSVIKDQGLSTQLFREKAQYRVSIYHQIQTVYFPSLTIVSAAEIM